MKHPYKVTDVKKTPAGRFISADLCENGIVVARIRRGERPWVYRAKFLSSQAEARFDDWCDCLSRSETLEAIMPTA